MIIIYSHNDLLACASILDAHKRYSVQQPQLLGRETRGHIPCPAVPVEGTGFLRQEQQDAAQEGAARLALGSIGAWRRQQFEQPSKDELSDSLDDERLQESRDAQRPEEEGAGKRRDVPDDEPGPFQEPTAQHVEFAGARSLGLPSFGRESGA